MRQLLAIAVKRPLVKSRHFIGAWVRSPFSVGAIVPSSKNLGRAMVEQVDLSQPGLVIELGAGTGVMTQALLQAGIEPSRLVVVERDARMAQFLERHFPQLTVVCRDAADIGEIVASRGRGTRLNAIVSSLPLLSMPKHVRQAIEEAMTAQICDGGRIIQFTYGAMSPVSRGVLRKYHLSGRRVKTVVANVPPAHVWVYQPTPVDLRAITTP